MEYRPVKNSVLETIGDTPIVRLNKVAKDVPAEVYVKLEFMNPGGSIKDRIGWYMMEAAEKEGKLKPGGTIVECTSGNTGVGIAIAAAIRGYRCVFTLSDKMSQEKIKNLRAFGAKVVVCPAAVEADDPRSYYSVAKRISSETPNSIWCNQYDNLYNREAHYKFTAPEIHGQMPDLDYFIAGIGTGGTVCGISKYLKEKNPSVKTIAIDPVGSIVYDVFHGKKDVQAMPYKVEGIGEDMIPKNYDFDVIDEVEQIDDKDAFLMTRELLTKEGLYCGVSSGAAVAGALKWLRAQGTSIKGKKVLVILPDSGNRYLSKVFDDDWMREAGFLDASDLGTVQTLLSAVKPKAPEVVTAQKTASVSNVIELMRERGISQLPLTGEQGRVFGVVTEGRILTALYDKEIGSSDSVEALADPSVELVHLSTSVDHVSSLVKDGKIPLVVDQKDPSKILGIITKIDLLTYLGNRV